MNKDNLYIYAGLSTVFSAVVVVLFIIQLIMICTGWGTFPPQKLALACLFAAALVFILNTIITISEGDGDLTFFLPLILLVGIVLALIFKSLPSSILYLVLIIIFGIALTVINFENTRDYILPW